MIDGKSASWVGSKFFTVLVFCFALTLTAAGCKKEQPVDEEKVLADKVKVSELMASAYDLFKNDNFAMAEVKAAAALFVDSQLVDAELLRAKALMRLNRQKEAIAAYNRAMEIDPESLSALLDARILLKQTGKLKDIIEMYRNSIKEQPDSGLIYVNLGLALEADGQREPALEAISKGAALVPENARAQYELGRAYIRLGRTAEALPAFGKASEIDPEMMEARFEYARLLEYTGKQEQALAEFRQIAAKFPNDENALIALGTALGKQGEFREAAEQLEKAYELNPFSLPAANNLARAQMEFDLDAAIKTLTIFSERVIDKPDRVHELAKIYVGLSICMRKKNQIAEGYDYLKKASELMPADLLILRQLSIYARDANQRSDEVEALKLFVKKADGLAHLAKELQKAKLRLVELGEATSLQ
jgi:tetratricopeptide (TPR) repeat protein